MKNRVSLKRNLIPYIYCLPGLVVMSVFILVPILLSLAMSFFKVESVGSVWEFIGLENYAKVFNDNEFFMAFVRTLVIGIFGTVTGLFFGLLLSLMTARHRMLGFFRYVFYIPSIVSAITMGRLWSLMLTPNPTGLLNIVVKTLFGVENAVNWLGEETVAFCSVLGIGLIGCGGGMTYILFTTAILNVPTALTEAASLEGANAWQRSVHIIIPCIKPVISSWLLLSIISSFKSFEMIYALTGGGPGTATTTLAILLYNSSLSGAGGYGGAAAMGFLLTLIVMVFALFYIKFTAYGKEQ
ncbi:MAG: carbohydrate ABC transporter permease [Christensenellales bacterium]